MQKKKQPIVEAMRPILITGPNKEGNDELLRQELRQYKATEIYYVHTKFKVLRKKQGRVVVFRRMVYSDLARVLEVSKKFKVVATSETINPSKRPPYQDHEALQRFDIKDYWPTPTVNSILSPISDGEEELITITLLKSRVERICHRIDDLLCWAEGFKTGLGPQNAYGDAMNPFHQGINGVKDIHDYLKFKMG